MDPVRASDGDREQALELLSTAAGDGRLTLEEYSVRADRALAARMLGDLSELTTDLQRPPDVLPVAREPERLVAILSSDSRVGRWTVPAHLEAKSVLGECRIELQDAVLTSHVTRIDARTILGSVTITVPEGVEVRLSGRSILGEKVSRVSQAPLPGAPVIEVRANVILGNVSVLPAKLSQVLHASAEEWVRPSLDQRSGGG